MPGVPVQPKPQAQPAAKAKTPVPVTDGSGTPSEYAMMLADPLNARVVGRPDENNLPTTVCRVRDVHDVKSTADGHVCIKVIPAPANGYQVHTFVGDTVDLSASITGLPIQHYTRLNEDNAYMRVLVTVVEWMPTAATDLMSGRACFLQYATNDTSQLPGLAAVSTLFDDEGIAFAANTTAVTIARPWRPVGFTNNNANGHGLPYVVFAATGLPPNLVFGQLVVTRVIELLPRAQVLARASAKYTVCDMMACCQAANINGRAVTYAAGPTAGKDIVSAAKKLLLVIAKIYKSYQGGPLTALANMMSM